MNILTLADFSPPFLGSFGKSQLELSSVVRERGHGFRLCIPSEQPWLDAFRNSGTGVDIVPVDRYPTSVNQIRHLERIISENKIDIVHTHFGLEHLVTVALLKQFRFPELMLVHHWRGGPARSNVIKRLIGTPLYKYVGRYLLDYQITNSQAIYDQISRLGFAPSTRIECIYNGVDTEGMSISAARELRSELNIPQGAKVILHVRNFRVAVDFDLIVNAFHLLADRMKDVYIVFVGDGEMRGSIETQLLNSAEGERARFVGTAVRLENYYFTADLTISSWEPWCSESINNSVYESLAMETPIVGVNTGSLPSLFDNEQGVFTSEPIPEKMADLMKLVLEMGPELKEALVRGRKKVEDEHSLISWARAIADIYERIFFGE
ncbi:MAG: glycosyltransferase family 4 protein [Sphaerochaetaceae bacterium]|nr:glycosyltransferase family 4 protein [Sphaerochaetaceae bacterium]